MSQTYPIKSFPDKFKACPYLGTEIRQTQSTTTANKCRENVFWKTPAGKFKSVAVHSKKQLMLKNRLYRKTAEVKRIHWVGQ